MKITRNRTLHHGTKICSECINNINNNCLEINKDSNGLSAVNDDDNVLEEDSLIYLDTINKYVNVSEDIAVKDNDCDFEMLTEFIKNTLSSTIDKLYETIEFLKNEVEEKNLLIKALLIKDGYANSSRISMELLVEPQSCIDDVETTSTISHQANYSQLNESLNSIPGMHNYDDTIVSLNNIDAQHADNNLSYDSVNLNDTIVMNSTRNVESIEDQLKNYRIDNHNKYMYEKLNASSYGYNFPRQNSTLDDYNDHILQIPSLYDDNRRKSISDDDIHITALADNHINAVNTETVHHGEDIQAHPWPENTVLITGSSILNGLIENRMNKHHSVKVRKFPGANTKDMYDYITPLLRKRPKYIFLHIGSNDAPHTTSEVILQDIQALKDFIETRLPESTVYLSCPVLRFDDVKAGFTLHHLDRKLKSLGGNIVNNSNIDGSCLSKGGLHLNDKGSGRLAMNFLSLIRRL